MRMGIWPLKGVQLAREGPRHRNGANQAETASPGKVPGAAAPLGSAQTHAPAPSPRGRAGAAAVEPGTSLGLDAHEA